mmetsp:Transcript_25152/g.51168  ORF Transcript_25152/g.51168 Transcript_25152/m.51168 type:complete len:214 (+) Transcript_25152:123-764(+)
MEPDSCSRSSSQPSLAPSLSFSPHPSLGPSSAPSPILHRRLRRQAKPGDIGWGLTFTEGDFLRSMQPESYRNIRLNFSHIPAEMKREYKLSVLQGSQTLPSPTNIDSQPVSPALDRRFYRRDGAGSSGASDLKALKFSGDAMQTYRAFDRRNPSSPGIRPSTSVSSPGRPSTVGSPSRHQTPLYRAQGMAGRQYADIKSRSSSGSSTPKLRKS